MNEYHCPTCGPKWHGAFNLDHRCITCGDMIHVASEQADHSDDQAVDRFASAMKSKLSLARTKGRQGWEAPDKCSVEYLATLLLHHVGKGNAGTFEDIANLAMMLHQRNAHPSVLAKASSRRDTQLLGHALVKLGERHNWCFSLSREELAEAIDECCPVEVTS